MKVFEVSRNFPKQETYSRTDQILRSSRSVATHIAEGWRRRRYEAAFGDKLNGAEGEATETQEWIEFAVRSSYVDARLGRELHRVYDQIIGKLVVMQNNTAPWLMPRKTQ
jgi:four helix bundle protein